MRDISYNIDTVEGTYLFKLCIPAHKNKILNFIFTVMHRLQSLTCLWTLRHLFYLKVKQDMCTPRYICWKFALPVHPVVPFLTEYPSWQWQMKEPLVFSHSPNIQMLEFKSHSFTSVSTHKIIISGTLLSFNSILCVFGILSFRWKYQKHGVLLWHVTFINLHHNITYIITVMAFSFCNLLIS